jgi:hypothetical protein
MEIKPFGRSGGKQKSNTDMYFERIRWVGVDRIELAQRREKWWPLVNAVLIFRVP